MIWLGVSIVWMIDADAIRVRWESVGSKLDERGRRLFGAAEVRAAGRGGLALVSKITRLARSTTLPYPHGLSRARIRLEHVKLERALLAAHLQFPQPSTCDTGRKRCQAVQQCGRGKHAIVLRPAGFQMRAAEFIASPISAISFLSVPSSPTATGPQ